MGTNGMATKGAPAPVAARTWDAVVIGGGHNALITAAYLARGGLRTLVLERRERLGGAADTANLARHIRVPALAHTVGRLRPSVQRDLGLSRHGLSLVAPDGSLLLVTPTTIYRSVAPPAGGGPGGISAGAGLVVLALLVGGLLLMRNRLLRR